MRYLFLLRLGQHGFGAAASREAVAQRPALLTWLALVAGVTICAIATLLL